MTTEKSCVCWFVYVLRNPDGKLYIGQTRDLSFRLHQHNDPKHTLQNDKALSRTVGDCALGNVPVAISAADPPQADRRFESYLWSHSRAVGLLMASGRNDFPHESPESSASNGPERVEGHSICAYVAPSLRQFLFAPNTSLLAVDGPLEGNYVFSPTATTIRGYLAF